MGHRIDSLWSVLSVSHTTAWLYARSSNTSVCYYHCYFYILPSVKNVSMRQGITVATMSACLFVCLSSVYVFVCFYATGYHCCYYVCLSACLSMCLYVSVWQVIAVATAITWTKLASRSHVLLHWMNTSQLTRQPTLTISVTTTALVAAVVVVAAAAACAPSLDEERQSTNTLAATNAAQQLGNNYYTNT